MKAHFDGASIKVWFKETGICRVFANVATLEHAGNRLLIVATDGKHHLLNMDNVNMVEELD